MDVIIYSVPTVNGLIAMHGEKDCCNGPQKNKKFMKEKLVDQIWIGIMPRVF